MTDVFDDIFAEEKPAPVQQSKTVSVNLESNSYDIEIGSGILTEAGTLIQNACPDISKIFIIADRELPPEYADTLCNSLFQTGVQAKVYPCAGGDENKVFPAYQQLATDILAAGIDRKAVIITLGGGVTGDLGGFIASTLLRGIRFVQIPTTLLSQVDSSVGGKTGINTPSGKNLVGTFWQPSLVIIDTELLQSLPERELKAGYAEILKYGLINDIEFFEYLEQSGLQVLAQQPAELQYAIATSCQNKATVVAADELEKGQRALLNLGHTFGHALEAVLNYDDRLLHGEAVALGCLIAFKLSVNLGYCPVDDFKKLQEHQEAKGYPITLPNIHDWDIDALIAAMYKDKKTTNGALNLVLVSGIGKAFIAKDVPENVIRDVWAQFI